MTSLINQLIMWAKDLKVLYVEDDKSLREELSLLLSDLFAAVGLAENGKDGLSKVEEGDFDIVITDIRMPVLDGIGMIEELKKSHPSLPVIVISAHNESEYLLKLINLGIENFVTKPLRSEQVFAVLHRVIEQINKEKELRRYKQELEVANKKLKKIVNLQAKNIDFKTSVLNSYRNALYEVALISVTDKDGIIKDVNENFCNAVGYTKDEIVGQKHNLFKNPQTDPSVYKDMWESIRNKKIWHGMLINQSKTFTPIYHYTTIIPILDDQGEIYEYVAIKQDLTKFEEVNQTKLKKSVEESQSIKQEDILKALPFPSIIFDKRSKIQHYNKLFEKFISELEDVNHYTQLVSNSLSIHDFLQQKGLFSVKDNDFVEVLCDMNEIINIETVAMTIDGEKEFFLKIKKYDENLYVGCLVSKEDLESCFLAIEN